MIEWYLNLREIYLVYGLLGFDNEGCEDIVWIDFCFLGECFLIRLMIFLWDWLCKFLNEG